MGFTAFHELDFSANLKSSVVFQALAHGKSTIDAREPSLHTQTARWVVEQLLGIRFDESGHCEGIGLHAKLFEGLARSDKNITEALDQPTIT